MENAYQQGVDVVKLNGKHASVHIPDRVQVSTSGTKRAVIRGTYFVNNGIELFPLGEEVAGVVEQHYQLGRWNTTVTLAEKPFFFNIKGPDDIRRYEIGQSEDEPFISVQRGFPGMFYIHIVTVLLFYSSFL